jgi:hypothetical protein
MVLTGLWRGVANGRDGLVRMHYTREAGGAVRQRGEVSTDNGRTWAPSFDLTYRPPPRTDSCGRKGCAPFPDSRAPPITRR